MKLRIHKTLEDGRVVAGGRVPLHLRIDLEDGRLAKVAFGIDQKGGDVNWQLSVTPASLSWAVDCVEKALLSTPDRTIAQQKGLAPGEGDA